MAASRLDARRLGLLALVLLALFMLSMVVYVVTTGDRQAAVSDDDFHEDPVVNLENAPTVDFPENLRSYDSSLNVFLDRFIRLMRAGKYTAFREMWTRNLDPISADEYAHIWNKVRQVRVLGIQKIQQAPASAPAYLVNVELRIAEAEGQPDTQRQRRIAVIREGDRWAFAPFAAVRAASTSSAPATRSADQ